MNSQLDYKGYQKDVLKLLREGKPCIRKFYLNLLILNYPRRILISIRNGCEIWYNRKMANKNTTKTRRRPSKAELERKQAIQRMLISLGIALLLIIAALKLGAAGITLYNLIRLVVGSLAYVAIGALLIYLFLFKWIRKQEGLLSGFLCIFAGLLLIFEAYLVWK